MENSLRGVEKTVEIFDRYPPLTCRVTLQLRFLRKMRAQELVSSNTALVAEYLATRALKYVPCSQLSRPPTTNLLSLPYYRAWLSGFIEAGGCFSVPANGKTRFFSIGQKFDHNVLDSIREYLQTNANVSLRKSGVDFFYLEIYNCASLARLVAHCEKYLLLGEKGCQLAAFVACTPQKNIKLK